MQVKKTKYAIGKLVRTLGNNESSVISKKRNNGQEQLMQTEKNLETIKRVNRKEDKNSNKEN